MNDKCKICDSNTQKMFSGQILNKYKIDYFKCKSCGFIQTETPFWLQESYSSVIAITDIGLVSRNLNFQSITSWIIKSYFDYNAKFIDFAGGYGLFVRLMRDKGFQFYRQDFYCENYFAQYFDIGQQNENSKYELLTAFEVFEHLTNPIEEIHKMFEFSDSIFFSTELQPQINMNSIDDWRYFAKETGQHVAFFTLESLELIAKKMNCFFYSNNVNLHILSKKELLSNPFNEWENKNKKSLILRGLYKVIKYFEYSVNKKPKDIYLESLLEKDYEFVVSIINKR